MLRDLAKLSDFMRERWDKVIGYGDFIRKLNLEINDGDRAFWTIPDDPDLVAQYGCCSTPTTSRASSTSTSRRASSWCAARDAARARCGPSSTASTSS